MPITVRVNLDSPDEFVGSACCGDHATHDAEWTGKKALMKVSS